MANEAETYLDLRHQKAHLNDGIFIQLLETLCLCNWLMNEKALSE